MPKCSNCKDTLPDESFYKNTDAKNGLASWCKHCTKMGKRRPNQVKYARWLHIYRTYGITEDDYNLMLKQQNYGCKICGVSKSSNRWSGELHIDHDHVTNTVRGLLCSECNMGLGKFKDDINLLRLAINYLEQQCQE